MERKYSKGAGVTFTHPKTGQTMRGTVIQYNDKTSQYQVKVLGENTRFWVTEVTPDHAHPQTQRVDKQINPSATRYDVLLKCIYTHGSVRTVASVLKMLGIANGYDVAQTAYNSREYIYRPYVVLKNVSLSRAEKALQQLRAAGAEADSIQSF